MELSASVVMLATGSLLPVVVAALTKGHGSNRVKQALAAGLSAVGAAFVSKVTTGQAVPLNGETLGYAGTAFLAAVLSYSNLYKPRDINTRVLPGFGIGRADPSAATTAATSPATTTSSATAGPGTMVSTLDLAAPVNPFA